MYCWYFSLFLLSPFCLVCFMQPCAKACLGITPFVTILPTFPNRLPQNGKKIKQRFLAAFLFRNPGNAGLTYWLLAAARWATSRRLLPSTRRRPGIHLQILESLSHRCRFKIGKVVVHPRNYFLFLIGWLYNRRPTISSSFSFQDKILLAPCCRPTGDERLLPVALFLFLW